MKKGELAREQELRESIEDPDELREIRLAVADVRAAPGKLMNVLKLMYAHGFRRGWDCRERCDADTIPPTTED